MYVESVLNLYMYYIKIKLKFLKTYSLWTYSYKKPHISSSLLIQNGQHYDQVHVHLQVSKNSENTRKSDKCQP